VVAGRVDAWMKNTSRKNQRKQKTTAHWRTPDAPLSRV